MIQTSGRIGVEFTRTKLSRVPSMWFIQRVYATKLQAGGTVHGDYV